MYSGAFWTHFPPAATLYLYGFVGTQQSAREWCFALGQWSLVGHAGKFTKLWPKRWTEQLHFINVIVLRFRRKIGLHSWRWLTKTARITMVCRRQSDTRTQIPTEWTGSGLRRCLSILVLTLAYTVERSQCNLADCALRRRKPM